MGQNRIGKGRLSLLDRSFVFACRSVVSMQPRMFIKVATALVLVFGITVTGASTAVAVPVVDVSGSSLVVSETVDV